MASRKVSCACKALISAGKKNNKSITNTTAKALSIFSYVFLSLFFLFFFSFNFSSVCCFLCLCVPARNVLSLTVGTYTCLYAKNINFTEQFTLILFSLFPLLLVWNLFCNNNPKRLKDFLGWKSFFFVFVLEFFIFTSKLSSDIFCYFLNVLSLNKPQGSKKNQLIEH